MSFLYILLNQTNYYSKSQILGNISKTSSPFIGFDHAALAAAAASRSDPRFWDPARLHPAFHQR